MQAAVVAGQAIWVSEDGFWALTGLVGNGSDTKTGAVADWVKERTTAPLVSWPIAKQALGAEQLICVSEEGARPLTGPLGKVGETKAGAVGDWAPARTMAPEESAPMAKQALGAEQVIRVRLLGCAWLTGPFGNGSETKAGVVADWAKERTTAPEVSAPTA
jgi:hypothetical protein